MKKAVLCAIACFSILSVLSACGGGDSSSSTAATPQGGNATTNPPVSTAPNSPVADPSPPPDNSGDGNIGNSDSPNGVAAIAGLWDESEDLGAEGTDVSYVRIQANGTVTVYDYQGDSADQGPDCAVVGTGTVTNPSGNTYAIEVMLGSETDSDTVQANIVNGQLVVSFIDSQDEDEDGNTTETLTLTLPPATNVPTSHLTSCTAPPPSDQGGDPDDGDASLVDPTPGCPGTMPCSAANPGLAGLWSLVSAVQSVRDLNYLRIGDDGLSITVYDYQDDALGDGSACSIIGTGTMTRASDGMVTFDVSTGSDRAIDVGTTILNSSGGLIISIVDMEDEDEDGSTTDRITHLYGPASIIAVPSDHLIPCPG